MMNPISAPTFPPVIKINGHGYVSRHALEDHKAALIAHALGVDPVPVPRTGPDTLVKLRDAGAELGVSRRTIARRVVEAKGPAAEFAAA